MPPPAEQSAVTMIGAMLCRAVVPLWIGAGAVFKLVERTPSNLPSAIVRFGRGTLARWLDADPNLVLALLLRSLISIEFAAVGLMLFLPRVARPTALFMLASFCAILINELRLKSTSCGCFGSVSISPAVMLAIDGTLLLAVILFRPARGVATIGAPRPGAAARSAGGMRWAVLAAWLVATASLSFAIPEKAPTEQPAHTISDGSGSTDGTAPALGPGPSGASSPGTALQPPPERASPQPPMPAPDPTINPSPLPLKQYYSPRVDQWPGKPWREIDLFQFMPRWPKDLDQGRCYVIFYRKSCDHCHDLLDLHFTGKLSIPTVAIAIPPDPGKAETAMSMPCTECTLMELPAGTQWLITAPIVVAIEEGQVVAAVEGDDPNMPQAVLWPQ